MFFVWLWRLLLSHFVCQAFGINFRCLSCSEPTEKFREFALANHSDVIQCFYRTMGEQSLQKTCALHTESTCSSQRSREQADLLVFGTPCPPFSTQRPDQMKRSSYDVVKSHRLYTVTFEESLALLESVEPKAAILEQVSGFGMAAHDMDTSSPKDRQDKQDVLRNAHWVCTRTFFPAARWGSLDFNKGATPSSPFLVPSFLASSPCQLQMLRSAKDAVECAWTRD